MRFARNPGFAGLAGIGTVVTLLAACSSGSGPGPAAGVGTIGAAANACNLKSGFAGDDVCIPPPDPSKGFQLHYGPSNYDDPAEVAKYLIAPGEETNDCFFVKTPNVDDRFYKAFHVRMRPGSHHLIGTALGTDMPDGLGSCTQGADSRGLGGSQSAVRDFPDPTAPAPENAGLGLPVAAHAQASLNLHYVNATNAPLLREAWINYDYVDPSEVTQVVGSISLVGGLGMNILPGTTKLLSYSCDAPEDMRVIDFFGHYHAHTARFSAWKIKDGEKSLVYESYDWHEPGDIAYDSAHQNPAPDPDAKTPGGASGVLDVKAGETLAWECEIVNDGPVALTFKNEVFTGEMCILFGSAVPISGRGPTRFTCANP
jgi:hypothetical protein